MNKRRPAKIVKQEKEWIFQYVLINVMPCDQTDFTPMTEVFEGYKKWMKIQGLGETKLSLDSFGRLFPKNIYTRILCRKNGKLKNGFQGVRLA